MLLLGARTNSFADPEEWTARRQFSANADEVLRALTDPDAIAEWAPVAFEVDGLTDGGLEAGGRGRVSGSIAGIGTAFEIEVKQANLERLELIARGPITFDVTYRLDQRSERLLVEARVALRRERGLTAQILRAAAAALLNAHALDAALRRLESAVAPPAEAELVAA